MNGAADRVNHLQEELGSQKQERAAFERLWPVSRARVVGTIGEQRLARARPRYEQHRFCQLAKEAAQLAGTRYACAQQADINAVELEQLSQQHAKCIARCCEAQSRLAQMQKSGSQSWAATLPFFEAEEEHLSYLSELDGTIEGCSEELAVAKTKYQAAMRGLEALSDSIHRRRA